jgi:hypothetical protein
MSENENASEYVLTATCQPCFSSAKHSKIILSNGEFLGTFSDTKMLEFLTAKRQHKPFILEIVKRRVKPVYPAPKPSEVIETTIRLSDSEKLGAPKP